MPTLGCRAKGVVVSAAQQPPPQAPAAEEVVHDARRWLPAWCCKCRLSLGCRAMSFFIRNVCAIRWMPTLLLAFWTRSCCCKRNSDRHCIRLLLSFGCRAMLVFIRQVRAIRWLPTCLLAFWISAMAASTRCGNVGKACHLAREPVRVGLQVPDLSTTKLFVGWPTLDEVDPVMAEAFQYGDWDEDGNLNWDEFAAWWVEAVYIKEAVVNEHFDWYDLDGDEIISVDEVLDGRWVQDLPD